MGNDTAQHAVEHVTNGESYSPPYPTNVRSNDDNFFDWPEFWHMTISWFVSGLMVFVVLIILTMATKPTDFWKDIVNRIDTISLVFSLVLSAGLEQVWNNKKQWKYKLTQIGELALAILGLILYLTYSLWAIYDPCNPYYIQRFWVNIIYILFSIVFVVFGFAMRAIIEQEVNK